MNILGNSNNEYVSQFIIFIISEFDKNRIKFMVQSKIYVRYFVEKIIDAYFMWSSCQFPV